MAPGRFKSRSSPHPPTTAPTSDRKFSRMKKYAEKMRFERTGLVPDHSEEYVNLKNWYKDMMSEYQDAKMKQNDLDMNVAKAQNREVARVFGGKTVGDGNAGILGLNTIWARGWTATESHPQAPWPTTREFREEGDERHTSNYGRFLPIPRVPGNKTVVYKQKSWAPVEPFDNVMPVPKLYGMVNVNMFGFFNIEVDPDGVPYDDHSLPGKEYTIKMNEDSLSKHESIVASCSGARPVSNMQSAATIRSQTGEFVLTLQEMSSQSPSEGETQHKVATFGPSNILALNPGRNRHADLEYATEEPGNTEAFKRDFFGPVYDVIHQTPPGRLELRSDALGFTDPWKTRSSGRSNLRTNTNIGNAAGNGSPVKFSRQANTAHIIGKGYIRGQLQDLSPGIAFRQVNSIQSQQMSPGRDKNDFRSGLESPIEFRKTPAFSTGKSRANKPAPLKLKPRRYADVVKICNNDSDDQEDGGVKLE